MSPSPNQSAFFARLGAPFTGEALFDRCPDVVFFVKDAGGRYVVVNDALAARCGARRKADLLGRTASEVFPPPLGAQYENQDRHLLRTGRAVREQLELHLFADGRTGWCLTTKLPLTDPGGRVVGLAGVSRDLPAPRAGGDDGDDAGRYAKVAAAVAFARGRPAAPPTVAALAARAGLSPYQFDRRIRRLFGLSAGQLLLKQRLDLAADLLAGRAADAADGRGSPGGANLPIAAVALACGYADQSAFARQFRRTTGLTPAQFRRVVRGDGPADGGGG